MAGQSSAHAKDPRLLPPASQRFAQPDLGQDTAEVPDFQRHILPLMGRLGCNGRACHGSFQGQGGFRLSLFGYDFQADHKALLAEAESEEGPRTNLKNPLASPILQKPTEQLDHGGGKRMEVGSWQYNLLKKWIEGGAPTVTKQGPAFERLEVTPRELVFSRAGERAQLAVVAHWSDGTREVVTPLCRFRTNDESMATVDQNGQITAIGPGDTHVVVFYENGVAPVPVLLPVTANAGENYPPVSAKSKVDQLVLEKLKKLGILPSPVTEDAEFLRRVRLDLTGTLPTPEEVVAFLEDRSANKRAEKIDQLLASPEYAAWWATKLCDWTGNNAGNFQDRNLGKEMSKQWYDWIYVRLLRNEPYDKIVEGIVLSEGRQPDQSYEEFCREWTSYFRTENPADFSKRETMPHYWSRRTVRQPKDQALSFSYAFLGVRLQCAECHKHPFDQWTQQDFQQFTAFFNGIRYGVRREDAPKRNQMLNKLGLKDQRGNQVRKELAKLVNEGKTVPFNEVYLDERLANRPAPQQKGRAARVGRVITPKTLGGQEVLLAEYPDPRSALMEWMASPENPYFARAIVNRVWANHFGVGIVEPADDMNLANPPSNKLLIDWLTQEFVAQRYDLKWLHRTICNSQTYQRTWQPNTTNQTDRRNFSHALLRRMPAEVAYDALQMATAGSGELQELQSRFQQRNIGPSSGYLARGAKASANYVLEIFGKPVRETNCDCERSNEPSLLQTVFLRNDNQVMQLIERRGGWFAEVTGRKGIPAKDKQLAQRQRAAQFKRAQAAAKRLRTALSKFQQQAQELEQKGQTAQLKRVNAQIQRIRQRIAEVKKTAKAGPSVQDNQSGNTRGTQNVAVDLKPEQLIRQAYLKTLSRLPSDQELARAQAHLQSVTDQADGLRDLLWALLNTKEFLVIR